MVNQHTRVYWGGSPVVNCDLCTRPLIKKFYDAKTNRGPWGMLCNSCFITDGVGLGTGRGQKFERQSDGRWLKTGG